MKQLRRITILLALLLVCVIGTVAASAASEPRIQLSETGADYEYRITIQNWDSLAVGVQFDVIVDLKNPDYQMSWSVKENGTYQHIEQKALDGGKTQLTFYLHKKSPISNSATATIGYLSFNKLKKTPSFTTSGYMKVLRADNLEEGTIYQNIKLSLSKYQPPSSGGSGGSGGGGGGSGSSGSSDTSDTPKTWKDVSKGLETKDGVSSITLNMRWDGRLSVDVLKNLAKKKVQATLDYGTYQWLIDGATIGDIPSRQKYYDLTLNTKKLRNISKAANGSDVMQFETAYDGDLPFTAILRCKVGESYAGKTLFLAYYNEQDGLLEYRDHQKVDSKGYVQFSFDHFSRYVITSEDLWGILKKEASGSTGGNNAGGNLTAGNNNQGGAVIVPPANDPNAQEDTDEPEELEEPEELPPDDSELEPEQDDEPDDVPTSSDNARKSKGMVALAVVGALLCIIVIVVIVVIMYRQKRMQ